MKFLTLEQVAEILSLSKRTVLRWTQNYKIKSIKIGTTVRVDEKDLIDFINKNKRGKK